MRLNTLKTLSIVVALLAAPFAANAGTHGQDVVRDARGNIVVDSNGGCVLTKWEARSSECGREVVSVYFDFNRSALNAESKAKLDSLSASLNGNTPNVTIVGYADRIGNSDYNYRLSLKRANKVKKYLLGKGLQNVGDVTVEGLGSSESAGNCTDKTGNEAIQCLWEDRRVDVRLDY